ncbi:hypothetical protein [Rugamonas aquatica]|uniref:Lipoprotein n=1 Tax=Rugamonas aquatica TaxID=2743357 RepID=A0A6A7N7Y3_9BURK|nr:hypothetical protein [Rugamonas aquatica]MQA41200.1 hypothetical protein [Rugamonas aquatica]
MQRLFSLLLPLVMTSGCAMAQAPKAIEDVEPEVTQQVAAAVAKMAVDPAAAPAGEGASLLRACPSQAAPPLELLRRTVDGEERTYLYRTQCGKPLLVSATYGKNGAIKRLQLKAE